MLDRKTEIGKVFKKFVKNLYFTLELHELYKQQQCLHNWRKQTGKVRKFQVFICKPDFSNYLLGSVAQIVITFYSPSCLGKETAKGPFGLRVKLPPAHLSTTHDGGFTLSL